MRRAAIGVELAWDAGAFADEHNYIERQKLRDLTAQVNQTYRSEARSELLRETITEAVGKMKPFSIYYVPAAKTVSEANTELVLTIGDIHYGADILVEGLNGEILNRFDHDVFHQRMSQLMDETVDIIKRHNVSEVHLYFVGDL